ncbi:MAG: serine O-acetyltransferase EpsC [Methanobacterium sp.]
MKEINRTHLLREDLIRMLAYHNNNLSESNLRFTILKFFLISQSFRSIYFYRLANTGVFKKIQWLNTLLLVASRIFKCVDIPFTAKIGEGFFMGHPKGIILHPKCIIGKNATILQGVTIGGNIGKMKDGRTFPIIGDNVLIGAGAKILGPVIIGDNSMIGANAVVIKDIPNNSVAVGVPAKVIKKVKKPFIEIERSNKTN